MAPRGHLPPPSTRLVLRAAPPTEPPGLCGTSGEFSPCIARTIPLGAKQALPRHGPNAPLSAAEQQQAAIKINESAPPGDRLVSMYRRACVAAGAVTVRTGTHTWSGPAQSRRWELRGGIEPPIAPVSAQPDAEAWVASGLGRGEQLRCPARAGTVCGGRAGAREEWVHRRDRSEHAGRLTPVHRVRETGRAGERYRGRSRRRGPLRPRAGGVSCVVGCGGWWGRCG